MDDNEMSMVEVLEAIERTRQETGTLIMDLDGAQAHLIVESMANALVKAVTALEDTKKVGVENWNGGPDDYEATRKSSYQISLLLISALRGFIESLPRNLVEPNSNLRLQRLLLVEAVLRKEND